MIVIDDAVVNMLKGDTGVVEISGLPDSGVTSASIKLIDELIREEKDVCAAAMFSSTNTPNLEYLSRLIPSNLKDRFIMLQYEPYSTDFFILTIKRFGPNISYWLIDDFYNLMLYKNYTFIRDFLKGLKLLSKQLGITVFIVNQYRYILPGAGYEFIGDAPTKSLYIEHISPFLCMRLKVQKDKNNNITLNLMEKQKEKSPDSFLKLLNSLE